MYGPGVEFDANVPDTNPQDTNGVDTNSPDTNLPDTNLPDTNLPDTNLPDMGPVDTGVDSGPPVGDLAPVRITNVDLFQNVRVPLVVGGSPSSSTLPIVSDRDGIFRIEIDTMGISGQIEARVTVSRGGSEQSFTDTQNVSVNGGLPARGFQVNVPGSWIQPDSRFRVGMHSSSGGGTASNARFPPSGFAQLGAQDHPAVTVRLLPVRYNFDGSGRLPIVDAATVNAMHDYFEAMLPTADVQMDVVPTPLEWSNQISRVGFSEWSNVLSAVQARRSQDSPASHVYYIGLVRPAESFAQYCSSGCIAGIGPVNRSNPSLFDPNDPGSPSARASIAVGFGRVDDYNSAIHELGHTMGFSHSPCGGVSGPEPDYPYSGGAIGDYAWDVRSNSLVPPNYTDYMGYCGNPWIGSYNWRRSSQRFRAHGGASTFNTIPMIDIKLVNIAPFSAPVVTSGVRDFDPAQLPNPIELLELDEDGTEVGTVLTRRVALSIAGLEQWQIPADVAGVVLPTGQTVMLD